MNCVKPLGQRPMSRDFDRQVAEVRIRAAVLNRFTAIAIPVTVAAG
ncbi:ISSpo9, transposase [Sagittula stellata E-37]|uniref:ISSpo9, transposase n=1 Tax=Sagittula stellata (strain ATCC 700073 / DSM 11524 / E-37) TaxID=388399 RepID=A3JY70_SAGS3|nr:ISSpo9, transposase [Sagittula stellata E-37]EBA06536.1 ISSpo9, transposase [Sagittula stellata E-37]EBA10456.1 ISSpo9, transposase [Sagittula stellata E-37]